MSPENNTGQKRPYSKPRLRVLDLVAEEVLALGCKTTLSTNVATTPCTAGCNVAGS